MLKDFTIPLWLLKLGALVNLIFLADTSGLRVDATDAHVVVPARILFAVSAYRCLFPVRYEDNVVFHDVPLSSAFVTRLLATAAEVAYVYLFSRVIRLLNLEQVGWVDALSWLMVVQAVISQGFVWAAIVTRRRILYVYEELGWAVIFATNTVLSAYLLTTGGQSGSGRSLLVLSVLFGAVYLPWQAIHLRSLRGAARSGVESRGSAPAVTGRTVLDGLRASIRVRNRRIDASSWGGLIGLTWMIGYWATLIPIWVNHIVGELAAP